jgi:hypothetical protein
VSLWICSKYVRDKCTDEQGIVNADSKTPLDASIERHGLKSFHTCHKLQMYWNIPPRLLLHSMHQADVQHRCCLHRIREAGGFIAEVVRLTVGAHVLSPSELLCGERVPGLESRPRLACNSEMVWRHRFLHGEKRTSK